MTTQPTYVRLKLLLQQAANDSVTVKKVEAPRLMPLGHLTRKFAQVFGLPAPTSEQQAPFHVAIAVDTATLADADLTRRATLDQLMWETIDTQEAWAAALASKEKLLVRLTRVDPSSVASSRPIAKLQPMNPRKYAGVWPKFAPAPESLPILVHLTRTAANGTQAHDDDEAHEWELLDDDEFEREGEVIEGECKKAIAVPVAGVPTSISKPNRRPATALLAKLTGSSNDASSVTFAVNGATYVVANPSPTLKLIDYLRYEAGITGQKIGCGEGGCGACTVHLAKADPTTGQLVQFSTKACLHPVAALDGWAVTTTEGLGSTATQLHPIQQAMVDNWATQCGYCTPGFVMSFYGLLQENPNPTAQQIEDRFDGNLCRCTGYRPIFKAMRAVVGLDKHGDAVEEKKDASVASAHAGCGCGSKGGCGCSSSSSSAHGCGSNKQLAPCGKGEGLDCSSGAKAACASVGVGCGFKKAGGSCASSSASGTVDVEDLVRYDPTNPAHRINPVPRALAEHNKAKAQASPPRALRWTADATSLWLEPASLADVYSILQYYAPNEVCKLVCGNTSIGVTKYYSPAAADFPTVFIDVSRLPDLLNTTVSPNDGVYIGSSVTLTNLIAFLEATIASSPTITTTWVPLVRHLKKVANTGVRNVASWAGNIMIGYAHPEFPSDLITTLGAVFAQLQISSSTGTRAIQVSDIGTAVFGADEILTQLRLPFAQPNASFDSYKIRARHQNAHPIINAAYSFTYGSQRSPAGNLVIQYATLIVGGLTLRGIFQAPKTANYLAGLELTPATLASALASLDAEAVPGDRPDPNSTYVVASAAYRHSLVLTTFYKFFVGELAKAGVSVPSSDQSAYTEFVRPISSGVEIFTPDASTKPVGQAIPKLESRIQTTGEAKYIDDMPLPPNGLYAAFVHSKVALGTIASIDATKALAMPGVVRLITAADVAALPGAVNDCGNFPGDEEIFASTQVTATGQSIGLILADTRQHAEEAAEAVVINFSETPKPIITLADALAASPPSVFPDQPKFQVVNPPPITCGDFKTAYAAAKNKLEGHHITHPQYHFFFETQTCFSIPAEEDSLMIYSSSQGPTDIRGIVMKATGLPAHKVVVATPRTGGGFGGKLSRSHPIACATALAARITGRPIKAQTNRAVDMEMFGKRPDMRVDYQVGFDDQGKITALNAVFNQRGGHTYDGNFGTMSMCLMWADNAYFIPNYTVSGVTARTNTPSNTAMRAPGAFKSIWAMETLIERIAWQLKMDPNVVRQNNFYTEGQLTPYQQPVTNITLNKVWSQLQAQANYAETKAACDAFNTANKWRKRGVHMTAIKYGIAVLGNQVGILLNVMQDDGTILVSTTGCELGQGLNTKVAQTIAYELGIDLALIRVQTNATNIVANGSQTGGSATSESACQAAILACTELKSRLAPVMKANPGMPWSQLIPAANAALVNLTVSTQFNDAPGQYPFNYFVWTAGCSQVELDVLTGEVQVLKTDIVYDNGNSLNPAVDIGQIEGAFMQGLGHYLTEDIVYDANTGRLQTKGTWDYHPPCSQDIPLELNVTLLASSPNQASVNVLGSKATAEPPMMLSASVYFALRDCIAAARADRGQYDWFDLEAPATTQRVQQAIGITPQQLVL